MITLSLIQSILDIWIMLNNMAQLKIRVFLEPSSRSVHREPLKNSPAFQKYAHRDLPELNMCDVQIPLSYS